MSYKNKRDDIKNHAGSKFGNKPNNATTYVFNQGGGSLNQLLNNNSNSSYNNNNNNNNSSSFSIPMNNNPAGGNANPFINNNTNYNNNMNNNMSNNNYSINQGGNPNPFNQSLNNNNQPSWAQNNNSSINSNPFNNSGNTSNTMNFKPMVNNTNPFNNNTTNTNSSWINNNMNQNSSNMRSNNQNSMFNLNQNSNGSNPFNNNGSNSFTQNNISNPFNNNTTNNNPQWNNNSSNNPHWNNNMSNNNPQWNNNSSNNPHWNNNMSNNNSNNPFTNTNNPQWNNNNNQTNPMFNQNNNNSNNPFTNSSNPQWSINNQMNNINPFTNNSMNNRINNQPNNNPHDVIDHVLRPVIMQQGQITEDNFEISQKFINNVKSQEIKISRLHHQTVVNNNLNETERKVIKIIPEDMEDVEIIKPKSDPRQSNKETSDDIVYQGSVYEETDQTKINQKINFLIKRQEKISSQMISNDSQLEFKKFENKYINVKDQVKEEITRLKRKEQDLNKINPSESRKLHKIWDEIYGIDLNNPQGQIDSSNRVLFFVKDDNNKDVAIQCHLTIIKSNNYANKLIKRFNHNFKLLNNRHTQYSIDVIKNQINFLYINKLMITDSILIPDMIRLAIDQELNDFLNFVMSCASELLNQRNPLLNRKDILEFYFTISGSNSIIDNQIINYKSGSSDNANFEILPKNLKKLRKSCKLYLSQCLQDILRENFSQIRNLKNFSWNYFLEIVNLQFTREENVKNEEFIIIKIKEVQIDSKQLILFKNRLSYFWTKTKSKNQRFDLKQTKDRIYQKENVILVGNLKLKVDIMFEEDIKGNYFIKLTLCKNNYSLKFVLLKLTQENEKGNQSEVILLNRNKPIPVQINFDQKTMTKSSSGQIFEPKIKIDYLSSFIINRLSNEIDNNLEDWKIMHKLFKNNWKQIQNPLFTSIDLKIDSEYNLLIYLFKSFSTSKKDKEFFEIGSKVICQELISSKNLSNFLNSINNYSNNHYKFINQIHEIVSIRKEIYENKIIDTDLKNYYKKFNHLRNKDVITNMIENENLKDIIDLNQLINLLKKTLFDNVQNISLVKSKDQNDVNVTKLESSVQQVLTQATNKYEWTQGGTQKMRQSEN